MPWRDGCEPWPVVAPGAEQVVFAFGAADELGRHLHRLRGRLDANLASRARADAHLVDWSGGRRDEFDHHRATTEAVVTADGLGAQLRALRAAWDDAARAQCDANRDAAGAGPRS